MPPLKSVAEETLQIVQRGSYVSPAGAAVDLRAQIDAAVRGTVLYRPEDFAALLAAPLATSRADADADADADAPLRVEVTPESTAEASRRLVEAEGVAHVVALNFASAAVFDAWLRAPRFRGAFDRVVFGVYDRSADRGTLRAFEARFAARSA